MTDPAASAGGQTTTGCSSALDSPAPHSPTLTPAHVLVLLLDTFHYQPRLWLTASYPLPLRKAFLEAPRMDQARYMLLSTILCYFTALVTLIITCSASVSPHCLESKAQVCLSRGHISRAWHSQHSMNEGMNEWINEQMWDNILLRHFVFPPCCFPLSVPNG